MGSLMTSSMIRHKVCIINTTLMYNINSKKSRSIYITFYIKINNKWYLTPTFNIYVLYVVLGTLESLLTVLFYLFPHKVERII